MNGAPPSECGGGEEDAGASYVELGQGGQEVMVMVMNIMVKILRAMMVVMVVMTKMRVTRRLASTCLPPR